MENVDIFMILQWFSLIIISRNLNVYLGIFAFLSSKDYLNQA